MNRFAQALRNTSFSRQLSVVVALTVLSLAFASSLATSWQGSRQVQSALLEQGGRIAENLARQSKLALLYDSPENAAEAVSVTLAFPDVTALEIRHASGRLLLGRGAASAAVVPRQETPIQGRQRAYLEAESDDSWRFVAPVLAGGNESASPFEMNETTQEALGYVRVIQSKETLTRMRTEIFAVNFAVSFFFAIVFLLIVRRLTARLTQPLDRLSAAMARAGVDAGGVRAELSGPRDIVNMALSFNKMMTTLEGSKRDLQTLLDNLPAALVVHGADAAILYTNPAARIFFCLDHEHAASTPSTPPWHFVRADGSVMLPEEYPANRVIADGQPLHDYTVGIVCSDRETPRWTSVSAFPETDGQGRLDQIIVCLVDITERRQYEVQLHNLNESLEQRVETEVAKNRDKDALLIQQSRLATMGEMMHNVAHQWRQPLNALNLVLHNIKDAYEYGDLNQQMLDELVSDGNRVAQKMSTTIDDFRNFFRPDQQKIRFSLLKSIHEALHLVEASFRSNEVEVILEETMDIQAIGFPGEYSQVLLNVLVNAKDVLKSRQRDGKVIISMEKKDGTGIVHIRDNGGGIPEDVLPKVFDPYFTTKDGGSGIGLYMSRMIMGHMNGEISAHNLEGGAEFIIAVPTVD